MYVFIIVVLATILIGPFMFYVFSYKIYKKDKMKKYPTGLADAVGDVFFLPLFNATVAYYGIFGVILSDYGKLYVSIFLTLLFSTVFLWYRKYYSQENDWSRPKRGYLNLGGWYHEIFVIAESFIIFISMLHYYNKSFPWILLLGYLLTATYYWMLQVPKRAIKNK